MPVKLHLRVFGRVRQPEVGYYIIITNCGSFDHHEQLHCLPFNNCESMLSVQDYILLFRGLPNKGKRSFDRNTT